MIRIRGVRHLHGTTYLHHPRPDRGRDLYVRGRSDPRRHHGEERDPQAPEAISAKLMEMGCEVVEFDEEIRVVGKTEAAPYEF